MASGRCHSRALPVPKKNGDKAVTPLSGFYGRGAAQPNDTDWGTYGFWLPNDPSGSWSDFVSIADDLYLARLAPALASKRAHSPPAHPTAGLRTGQCERQWAASAPRSSCSFRLPLAANFMPLAVRYSFHHPKYPRMGRNGRSGIVGHSDRHPVKKAVVVSQFLWVHCNTRRGGCDANSTN
jgi:hypothetical protein